jgi:hypothetical protein
LAGAGATASFPDADGQLSTTAVMRIVRPIMLGVDVPVEQAHPHALRHTFGRLDMAAPKAQLSRLQRIMGHASPETTSRDVHHDDHELAAEHRRIERLQRRPARPPRGASSGAITKLNVPTPNSLPADITAGPDGNLWFTEAEGNEIGVVCIVLACHTHIKILQGPAVGLLATTLDRAVRVGILVERIVGTKHIRIGRVPFGFHHTGRLRIRWDLRVNGRKLPQGRYLVTLRALDNDNRVTARALPITIQIP